jgi:flagellar hook-length control protein FliK
MDNFSFSTMVNNLKTVKEKTRKEDRSGGGDPGLFSRLMEDEVKDKGSGKSKEHSAIEGEKKPDAEKKAQEKKEADQKEADLQDQMKKQQQLSPMQNFLFNLVLKNPDALSLSEKSALGLDKTSQNVILKDINKLLAERGLSMSELTSDHILELNSKASVTEARAFLDELARQKREGTLEQRAKTKLVEDAAAQAPRDEVKSTEKPVGAGRAEKQEAAEEAARARRAEVIDQVATHLEIQSLANRTELSMRLNPEYLGELKMKLTFEGGKMGIEAETPSRLVRDLLEEGEEDLRKQLGQKGVTLDTMSVKLVDRES